VQKNFTILFEKIPRHRSHKKSGHSCVFITEMKRIATRLENQPIEEINCAASLSQELLALGNGKASSFPEARARLLPSGSKTLCVCVC